MTPYLVAKGIADPTEGVEDHDIEVQVVPAFLPEDGVPEGVGEVGVEVTEGVGLVIVLGDPGVPCLQWGVCRREVKGKGNLCQVERG